MEIIQYTSIKLGRDGQGWAGMGGMGGMGRDGRAGRDGRGTRAVPSDTAPSEEKLLLVEPGAEVVDLGVGGYWCCCLGGAGAAGASLM